MIFKINQQSKFNFNNSKLESKYQFCSTNLDFNIPKKMLEIQIIKCYTLKVDI